MALFGATKELLLLRLAPITDSVLSDFGYDSSALDDLVQEKAEIVFSYLPARYRALFESRIYRVLVVKRAFEGQTTAHIKLPGTLSNFVCFKNPEIVDGESSLNSVDTVGVSGYSSNTLTFSSALSKGDVIVADFDQSGMDSATIKPLRHAAISLACVELLSVVSGELRNGTLPARVEMEAKKAYMWLEALNNNREGERAIIKELEIDFWESESLIDKIFEQSKADAEGLSI